MITRLKCGNSAILAEGLIGAVLHGTSFQAGTHGQQQRPICSSLFALQAFSTPEGHQVWEFICFDPNMAFVIKDVVWEFICFEPNMAFAIKARLESLNRENQLLVPDELVEFEK